MPVGEAKQFILSRITAISECETVSVRAALGRVLGADAIAPFNVPGHDNSAMDGFACRFADLNENDKTTLKIVGESFAGGVSHDTIAPGQCVKIMTGAQLPQGADVIVPKEETRLLPPSAVEITPAKRRVGTHRRFAGEDLKTGQVAVAVGTLCRPAQIGLLASLGMVHVVVYRRLRAAFFSTGDELRALDKAATDKEPLAVGQIYDSNRHTLAGMIERMGFEGVDLGIVKDDKKALMAAVDEGRKADVIITSGGASVGEADYIRAVLAARGEALFWKVAMRPGRPLAYGKVGETDFFGLPGNPVSVMVCFYQFVCEALWKRAGRSGDCAAPVFPATAATALKKSPGRMEFQRGVLSRDDKGAWQVTPTGDQGSGILSSMSQANCFIVLEEESGNVQAGEIVGVQLFEGLF